MLKNKKLYVILASLLLANMFLDLYLGRALLYSRHQFLAAMLAAIFAAQGLVVTKLIKDSA